LFSKPMRSGCWGKRGTGVAKCHNAKSPNTAAVPTIALARVHRPENRKKSILRNALKPPRIIHYFPVLFSIVDRVGCPSATLQMRLDMTVSNAVRAG
jgi:hypothetical protein